jgi:hypothetical protein
MFELKKWIKAVLVMLALSGGFVGSTQAASVLTLAEADGWSTMGGWNDQGAMSAPCRPPAAGAGLDKILRRG